jgi:hypothetical protein
LRVEIIEYRTCGRVQKFRRMQDGSLLDLEVWAGEVLMFPSLPIMVPDASTERPSESTVGSVSGQ